MIQIKYIRFGEIPASGYSFNFMDRRSEAGVSCYRLMRIAGEWRIDGAWGSYLMSLNSANRTCYEISGELLDEKGADGEPLLRNAKVVGKHRAKPYRDCWVAADCSVLCPTEKIYRHLISGELWFCFSGGLEERFTRDEAIAWVKTLTYGTARKQAILGVL